MPSNSAILPLVVVRATRSQTSALCGPFQVSPLNANTNVNMSVNQPLGLKKYLGS